MRSTVIFAVSLAVATAVGRADEGPHIDERASAVLRSTIAALRDAQRLRFYARVMSDELREGDVRLQRSAEVTLRVQRPNRLRADVLADSFTREIRYDGTTMTLYDPDHQLYAKFKAPSTLAETVKLARSRFGLDVPLAQLVVSESYDALIANVRTGTYVGLHRIGSTPCHHLLFTQKNVDWQIWIDAEGPPMPRRIVITHKDRSGQPQYIATLDNWRLDAPLNEDDFIFVPPKGSQEVEILQAKQTQ